jgi:WD40 repeat protein
MHIYHSALPWSPTSSLTRQLYQRQMTTEVKLVNAINAHWEACIRTISIPNTLITTEFSHTGSALAVVSEEDVKIFETVTGVATFEVDESAVSIAFSSDDDTLACGFKDGMLRVWDVQTSNLIQSFVGHEGEIYSIVFSPCGNMIVSGSGDNTVRIWDISLGCCKCTLMGHSDSVWGVSWSATGDQVVSGSWDASVRVWDVPSQTCLMILRGHTEFVTSVASSCNSPLFASGSLDGTVKVYDARSGDVLQSIPSNGTVSSIQFSTHGDNLLYTHWNSATIWDVSRNMHLSTINCDGFRAAFSPDGTRFAEGSDKFVRIYNTENWDSDSETVNNHSEKVYAITFAPDGRVMASDSGYHVKIWDTTSGDCLFTIDSHYPQSIVFSPDSAFVARWSDDSYAQVWSTHTRSLIKVARLNLKRFSSTDVALSPCGGRLVSQSSSQIILWDLGSGKRLARLHFECPLWRELRIAFAVDGSSVFVHKDDNIMQRWCISAARLSNRRDDSFSNKNQLTSPPLVFTPIQETLSQSVPRNCCRYRGDEWILDEDGKRILWLPPDRRGEAWGSECHGKKIAVGTCPSGRVYLADFSDALLLC